MTVKTSRIRSILVSIRQSYYMTEKTCKDRQILNKFAFLILVFSSLLVVQGCKDKVPPNLIYSIDDLPGRTIGALSGSPSARIAGELSTTLLFSSGEDMIKNLMAGSVDCVVAENTFAQELVAGTPDVRILDETLIEYNNSFAVAKENEMLLNAINTALAALDKNGTLGGLRDKYYSGRDYKYIPPESVAEHPGSLILAVTPDTPPNSYLGANGEYEGIDVEITRAVCDYLGVKLVIEEFEAGELITAIRFGKADIALDWLPGDGEELVNLSDSYAQIEQSIIVRR